MKNSIIIASLSILIASSNSMAQQTIILPATSDVIAIPKYRKAELGLRFMPTFSSFNITTNTGNKVKGSVTLGFGAGAMVAFNITQHIGIQGEIIYNTLSQKYNDAAMQREINVRYINIPLLLSINTGKGKPVNLNFVVGPQLGFNLGSSIKSTGGDTLITVFSTKKNDFGFAYGVGLEFALNVQRTLLLDIGFRGLYGFVNINNTTNTINDVNTVSMLSKATVQTKSAYAGITFLFARPSSKESR
jgi:opacity protein-like surface antigen